MAVSNITYLEQTSPADLVPAREHPAEIRRVEEISPEFGRYLYSAVGGDWHWTEKLSWTWDRWVAWLSRPGFETYVPTVQEDRPDADGPPLGPWPGWAGRGDQTD